MRIADLRAAHGWTQAQLAKNSGVGERTVQRAEANSAVSLETLRLLAAALGAEVNDLFVTSEEPAVDKINQSEYQRDRPAAEMRIWRLRRWRFLMFPTMAFVVVMAAVLSAPFWSALAAYAAGAIVVSLICDATYRVVDAQMAKRFHLVN